MLIRTVSFNPARNNAGVTFDLSMSPFKGAPARPSDEAARQSGGAGNRLRVLFISDTSRNGGPGRTLLDILKFLDRDRIYRSVLLPREEIVSRNLREANAAEKIFFEPGLIENIFQPLTRAMERRDFEAFAAVKFFRACANVLRAAAMLLRLPRHIRRENVDVIFCNGTFANFVGGMVALTAPVPVIWHVLYSSVAAPARALHQGLARAKRVRAIICVSQATARQFPSHPEKLRLIHDATDIAEADAWLARPVLRKEFGLGDHTVIFGAHGRILRRKGFIELVRAARIMLDGFTQEERARCRFFVFGDTPQDMRPDHLQECRALARDLGLADHVLFPGFRAEVRPYVADFDVTLAPSIYEDPLPLSVMEAMAMRKPVAAFAMGGIGEMISDGVEGRLVSGAPPDIEGLARACLDYFRDPELRLRHGAAARLRAERDFDARKHARRIEEELFRVAGRD